MPAPEENFAALNLELPPAPKAMAVYRTCIVSGNLVYVSGHGPLKPDGTWATGKVGEGATVEQGKHAAELTGLAILSTLKAHLGSLDKVKRVIKILGMVNCTPDFEQHPEVINGCSELFAKVWGQENGVGVRSAVGMSSLPVNITVEIEAVFELHN